MEGGISILLIFILVIVVSVVSAVGYAAGWWGTATQGGETFGEEDEPERRPPHTEVEDQAKERFIGT